MPIRDSSIKIFLITLLMFFAGFTTHTSFASSRFVDVTDSYRVPAYRYPVTQNRSSFCGPGHLVFQLGGFGIYQGKAQHIAIEDLVGDNFTVNKHWDGNVLLGLGYFFNGPDETTINCNCRLFSTMFGINAFYFPKTYVKGDVVQEELYTNLSYRYGVTHVPIYLAGKAIFNYPNDAYSLTLDLGVGVNIIHVSNFHETSIDNGITLPDRIFSSNTHAALSATAGVGIQFNNFRVPFECGYRFFYLGEGRFDTATSLTSALHTGNAYANAILCSVTV